MWNPLDALRRYRHLRRLEVALVSRELRIEPELRILHTFLKPNEAFFDVGANVGDYMYVAQKHISPEHIYAFEPQDGYVRLLKEYYPYAHIVCAALSSRVGEMQLKIPVVHGELYRTRGTLEHFKEPGEEHAKFETVQVVTLDSIAESFGNPKVACIKIDVEGHERAVLEGARETIKRCKPALIIELEQRHHTRPIIDLFRFVESLGYDGHFLNSKQKLISISNFDVAVHQQPASFKTKNYIQNFIFLPHEMYGKN